MLICLNCYGKGDLLRRNISIPWALWFVTLFFALPQTVKAGGGHRPTPSQSPSVEPADSQAFPVRALRFGDFTAMPFRLNDGRDAGVGTDARLLVDTAVNQSDKFRTIQPGGEKPMSPHGVLSGGISALVFEVASVGIKFGYRLGSGGGSEPINEGQGTRLTGELMVKVGQLQMDFRVSDPVDGFFYAATSVSQDMVGLSLEFKVNFDAFEIGPEAIWQQPLKDIVQAAASKAMARLARARFANLIPWSAAVLFVDAPNKKIIFDAPLRTDVAPGNLFDAYSACRGPDCFRLFLATVKAKQVNLYTEATVKNDPDGSVTSTIQPGSEVFIHYLSRP